MTQVKEKLGAVEFGRQLISSGDLDPIYIMLWNANLPTEMLHRWLLAYWCFYHSGTASWIVDQKNYWNAMEKAAGSKAYPRCSERRHFRGQNALKSVAFLKTVGVDTLFEPFIDVKSPAVLVMNYVQTWVGFGPWIAFKVTDMLERLGVADITFKSEEIEVFDSPSEGADMLYDRYGKGLNVPYQQRVAWADSFLRNQIGRTTKAPPRYERVINIQETETVLCKWKSHMNGHYTVGEDIESLCKSLLSLPSKTNDRMQEVVEAYL